MKAYQFPSYDTPVFDCKDKVVAVIGGGNTALDSVRVSKRLGARASHIIYRRTEEEMPARLEEIHHAKEEEIIFEFLRNPVEFIGDEKGWLTGMKLEKMELGEPDDSGRRRPVPIEGSEYVMKVDMVVIAVGNGSNPIIQKTTLIWHSISGGISSWMMRPCRPIDLVSMLAAISLLAAPR